MKLYVLGSSGLLLGLIATSLLKNAQFVSRTRCPLNDLLGFCHHFLLLLRALKVFLWILLLIYLWLRGLTPFSASLIGLVSIVVLYLSMVPLLLINWRRYFLTIGYVSLVCLKQSFLTVIPSLLPGFGLNWSGCFSANSVYRLLTILNLMARLRGFIGL